MPTTDYDIVGSYNNQRVSSIDSERSVNLFEYIDPQGKKPKNLLPTSGIVDSTIQFPMTNGGFRAQFVYKEFQYVVIGQNIFRIDANLAPTLLGSFTTSSGYVGIDANDHQVIFVDGVTGNLFDTLNLIFYTDIINTADTNFPPAPIDVCFIDGFFVIGIGGTNTFRMSGFNDGISWGQNREVFTTNFAVDPTHFTVASTNNFPTGMAVQFLAVSGNVPPAPFTTSGTYYVIKTSSTTLQLASSFANALAGTPITITADGTGTPPFTLETTGLLQEGEITSHPGNIVACRTLHRRVFLFSDYYTEVWENAGAANLPIRRNNALLIEFGTPAIGSIATGFDKLFFLSQSRDGLGPVMEIMGSQAAPISERALDFQLSQYASNPLLGVSDARAFIIKENGLIFYRLNFTKANHTFIFNDSMSDGQNKRWHEEEILNGDRHPTQTHAYFFGTNYAGDYATQVLYVVDSNLSSNNGESIRRMRIGKPICPADYHRLRIDRFHLDVLQGSILEVLTPPEDVDLLTELSEPLLTEYDINIILETDEDNEEERFPRVFLSYSKDGGQTYGPRLISPMGQIGERTFRTVWRKLGTTKRGQSFVPKIEFFNQIPFVILGAAWAFDKLPE